MTFRSFIASLFMSLLASGFASAQLHEWSNVEKLEPGTSIRVTEKDGDRAYGKLMVVTDLDLTLELEAGSQKIERHEIALIERFPTSVPKSLPRAAVGVGAALSLSSSSSPRTYSRSVAPTQEILDVENEPMRNGYYVDAVSLVATSAQMVSKAIESSRKTVVVYRSR